MALTDHEQKVRAAVNRTMAQGKLGAAQFRVDRAAKKVEHAKGLLADARNEFDAANIALEAAKAEFGMAKKAVVPAAPVVSVKEGEADPLAPIESQEG